MQKGPFFKDFGPLWPKRERLATQPDMPKPTLIMVPGLLCSPDLFRDQATGLADLAEIRVTMAQAAHDSLAAIARQILAEAPPAFCLAGLSMGGYVALEIMRQAPERVLKLALLDTSARPDTPEQSARRRDFMHLATMGKFKGVTPQLMPVLVHPDRLADAGLTGRIADMAAVVGPEGFLRQQTAIMARPDSRPDLARIACPTLVLCGEQDALTPADLSREMAAGIPDAELVLVPHCGHMATMEQPGAVNVALARWLTL